VSPAAVAKAQELIDKSSAPKVSGAPFAVGAVPSGAMLWALPQGGMTPQYQQLYGAAGFPVS
jgi:hypothetical protein